MNSLTIRPSHFGAELPFSSVVVSVGRETRSTQVAKLLRAVQRKNAYSYTKDQTERAVANKIIARNLGFKIHESDEVDVRKLVLEIIEEAVREDPLPRIAVDISSMTRELMAIWVSSLLEARVGRPLEVEFIYSHAIYSPPPVRLPLSKEFSAVIPEFAGIFSDSISPVMLILGVGYEPELALSFYEYLEPAKVLLFEPFHHDVKYTTAIRRTNKILFEAISRDRVIRYNVFSPFSLFQDIESAIQGASHDHRVHIAPYGLKTFAICSLLAAAIHLQDVLVWKLNPVYSELVSDRIPDGRISSLNVRVTA